MSKFNKFLAIGALALGVAIPASAHSNHEDNSALVKNNIEQLINKSIKTQFDKGFLTEKSKIDLSILSEEESNNLSSNPTLADNYGLHISGASNQAGRIGDNCVVNLVYDKKGDVTELFKEMNLQNEQQKEIAQKFVALHESFHCEFFKIDQPIIAFNKDSAFQARLNYILKDQTSLPMASKITYFDVLAENYADVGAAMALLKEYGTKNADVNYVVKNITKVRSHGYDEQHLDTHFSQVSLSKLLSPENISKLEKVDNTEFHKMLLTISNEGTQDVVGNHPKLAESFKSLDHLLASVEAKIVHTLYLKTFTPEELESQKIIVSNLAPNVERGLAYDFAQASLEDINFNKFVKEFRSLTATKEMRETLGLGGQHFLLSSLSDRTSKFDLQSPSIKEKFEPILDMLKEFAGTFPKHEQKAELSSPSVVTNKDVANARINAILNKNKDNSSTNNVKPH